MNYFKFHIGDYASATRHLSWDEDMAYRRLLDAYYMRESPLPLDMRQVYRLVAAASKPHRQAVDAVLAEFFTRTEDGFVNRRCEEEMASFMAKRDNAKASARKRWEDGDGNANAHANAHADEMRTHSGGNAPTNHYPLTTNQQPPPVVEDGDFGKVEKSLHAIPGINDHPVGSVADISPIYQLVKAGISLEATIIPKIRDILTNRRGKPIKSWFFFANIISEQLQLAPKANGHLVAIDDAKWARMLEIGREQHQWQVERYGPIPGQPGCRVPAHLLKAGDGDGWTEWRPGR